MSILIFGYGNPSRGDDALGPLMIERLEAALPDHPEWGELALLTDFQLQPEHALDLAGHERVLFVDASVSCPGPFTFSPIAAAAQTGYTTHAMMPGAVLAVYRQVTGREPPPGHLLTVRGLSFELGDPLSAPARANLEAAAAFVENRLREGWQAID